MTSTHTPPSAPRVLRAPSELRAHALALRAQGKRIALVPTMGALHEGHQSLLRLARAQCDELIMSIFVNPKQFGCNEDLSTYPRREASDLKIASTCGVDIVFCPTSEAMYPEGFQTRISLTPLSEFLCGSSRPGHFDGVATVVAKLWLLAMPHVAVFGQKDYQQLTILRRLAKDLCLDIDIVGAPIVRESDGLALSSRNAYLSKEERRQAATLCRGLRAAALRFEEGARDRATLLAAAGSIIGSAPLARIEYLELCCASTLQPVDVVEKTCLLAVAAHFGKTRLIDNLLLQPQIE